MPEETELLRAALAVQLGFVTARQVASAKARKREHPERPLTGILAEAGHLTPAANAALEAMVAVAVEEAGSDAKRLLASVAKDPALRALLAEVSDDENVARTLLEWKAPAPAAPAPEKPVPPSETERTLDAGSPPAGTPALLRESLGEKYEFKRELGRGGLGKVLEAVDRDFGRDVAVKMMLAGSSASAVGNERRRQERNRDSGFQPSDFSRPAPRLVSSPVSASKN